MRLSTRNRLFVVMGSCQGIYAARMITLDLNKGTPYRLLAGPLNEVSTAKLESTLRAFYSSFLSTRSVSGALARAVDVDPAFTVVSAVEAFSRGWLLAKEKAPRTGKDKAIWLESLVTLTKERHNLTSVKGIRTALKRKLKKGDYQHEAFNNYKRDFFMLAPFPELSTELEWLTFDSI